MKILHTSDWHLGGQICMKKRYAEQTKFLDWLVSLIEEEGIDVLIVAGDIFDSGLPSNRALNLYYTFLSRAARSCCRHVVITAGNHDSPSLINASRELCSQLNITVIGTVPEDPGDLVLLIRDEDENPGLIVCPVPYLRDQDIRTMESGESCEDKATNSLWGIRRVYETCADAASSLRGHLVLDIPIVATGHLFVNGGISLADDGRRDLSVGTLGAVGADIFPDALDYIALGHLHLPQGVNGSRNIRYSGAPLVMGFGEAGRRKSVTVIETGPGRALSMSEVPVPVFQPMCVLQGTFEEVREQIRHLAGLDESLWIDVVLDDPRVLPDADEQIRAWTGDSKVEVLRVRNRAAVERYMIAGGPGESLQDLTPIDVFSRKMDAAGVPHSQRQELMDTFCEVLATLQEDDTNEG